MASRRPSSRACRRRPPLSEAARRVKSTRKKSMPAQGGSEGCTVVEGCRGLRRSARSRRGAQKEGAKRSFSVIRASIFRLCAPRKDRRPCPSAVHSTPRRSLVIAAILSVMLVPSLTSGGSRRENSRRSRRLPSSSRRTLTCSASSTCGMTPTTLHSGARTARIRSTRSIQYTVVDPGPQ